MNDGIVKGGGNSTTYEKDYCVMDFSLDVMCCDPDDTTNCEQCDEAVGKIPIMKIGPNSDANSRFFVKTGMDTQGRDMGYFHIEELRYEGFNHENDKIDDIDMIIDGCNQVGPLLEFKSKFNLVCLKLTKDKSMFSFLLGHSESNFHLRSCGKERGRLFPHPLQDVQK